MTLKKSAVIIGAGIGGITTAVYLAKNDYKVEIYEKNSAPGGRCGQLIRNFYNLFQFANFKNIGLLIKLKTYISNWAYAKRFFKHPHLLMAYTFQNIYVGQSPFNSPAIFKKISLII